MTIDGFSTTVCWIVLAVGLVFTMLSARNSEEGESSEMMGSLLLILSGLMLAASARDLVLLFLGLELVSIPTYVLLYLSRRDALAQESTMKYFFLSILSSAILLYGFSFLYGIGGSMQFAENPRSILSATRARARNSLERSRGTGAGLILAGLGFKIAAVPFHFSRPTCIRARGTATRRCCPCCPSSSDLGAWCGLLLVSAAWFQMVWMAAGDGLFCYDDARQRGGPVAEKCAAAAAYSSIAHAGYMLVGLAVAFAVPRRTAPRRASTASASDGCST